MTTKKIKLIKDLHKRFFEGHQRSVRAKKHIIISLLLKGASIIIGLVLVPVVLNYLDEERYGIWLTFSSIIAWFSFFDIGMGNGLRNRFAESMANNNHELARSYVSTTYAFLTLIFIFVLLIFFIVNPLLDWQRILNTKAVNLGELSTVAIIVFTAFIFRFIFKLIGTILLADQRPAINNSFNTFGNLLALIIIFILSRNTDGSLINLSIVMAFSPLLILVVATFYFFSRDYKKYLPSVKYINFSKSKVLLNLGFKFFIIQIASIVFFSMTNFFIAQYEDQKAVAAYNISNKYLHTLVMVYSIVLTPIWSAVTDAYARNDYNWLKKTLKKLNITSLVVVVILALLVLISPFVYKVWIGDKVNITLMLTISIAIYQGSVVLLSPFSAFINGFGKLRISLFSVTIKVILYFPLVLLLAQKYGALGVVWAMTIVNLGSLVIEPLQVNKLVNRKAHGIWNK